MSSLVTSDYKRYVVGFALDPLGRVTLIRKNRPTWQAGRLNGIGGHIEDSDRSPVEAMEREFYEETGTRVTGWNLFVVMQFPGACIYFFRTHVAAEVLDGLRTTTDEEVAVMGLPIHSPMIPNLSWLLPLAAYTADTYEPIHVTAASAGAITPGSDYRTQETGA